jgi:hypothetical protein
VTTTDKKKLEDKLAEEKRKTHEANTQYNTMSVGKTSCLAIVFIMYFVLLRTGP